MKILVVGSGGREHAIVWKLLQSEQVDEVICSPGNGGIQSIAKCFDVNATDIDGMVKLAKQECVDMVFVAPDDPLSLGMVDIMGKNNIRAFGPSKAAARIEASKSFSKDLMKKYNIPTAGYEVFDDSEKAKIYIAQHGAPIVIKADGLALGKGVYICHDVDAAFSAVDEIMLDKKFGNAGDRIVIEEFLEGPEVSLLCFCDGKTIIPMVSSQDHKRAYDDDEGPNTGGMGAFSPSLKFTDEMKNIVKEKILLPTLKAMNIEKSTFKGVLYVGLMLTKDGIKVIEYNARFGDPEAQVVLPLLDGDLYEIIDAIIDERLDDVKFTFKNECAAIIVMASGGYPVKYKKGYEIKGLEDAKDVMVFHAGTILKDGKVLTNGGRVLGVTATGSSMKQALDAAYKGVDMISFKDAYYRQDIGKK